MMDTNYDLAGEKNFFYLEIWRKDKIKSFIHEMHQISSNLIKLKTASKTKLELSIKLAE